LKESKGGCERLGVATGRGFETVRGGHKNLGRKGGGHDTLGHRREKGGSKNAQHRGQKTCNIRRNYSCLAELESLGGGLGRGEKERSKRKKGEGKKYFVNLWLV